MRAVGGRQGLLLRGGRWLATGIALLLVSVLRAEDKKPENKDLPRLLVAVPLGVSPGVAAKLTIRGLKLDGVTEIRFGVSPVLGKIVSKGSTPVPNQQEADRVGNTQIEVEMTLPVDVPPGKIDVVAVNPAGESPPYALIVNGATPLIPEVEPNDGFAKAQPLVPGQKIDGTIHQNQNVDVYRIDGRAGQKLAIEVLAARHGSAVDSILTLYDANRRLLAANDDQSETADSRIDFACPADGAYYVVLQDAHDQGGPAHLYRLSLTVRD